MPARSLSAFFLWVMLLTATASGLVRAADGRPQATVVQDPQYGEVLYYFYQEDYFPAIVRLLAARQQGQLGHHDAEAELLLGGLYLSYGQHRHAAGIFERLLADNADPAVRDRTWFFLARIWQQRGYAEEALQALGNIQHELPQPLQWERLNLRAQILIERGDYAQAIDMLSAWRGRTEWSGYARFNLGVALARSGQLELATGILDELGQQAAWNEETVALRDKTNLALGYAYLQGGQPRAAKSVLQRVRLNGPFSNKALLGIGWAEAEVENYDRALVPWVELRGRSLLDPAVQESMLAVPYAMAKLDSISQAADYYLDAIEAFYEEGNRIDRTIDALRSGALLTALLSQDTGSTTGWQWTLSDLPEGSESRYLFSLLATHEFQEALKNYRDLDYLARNLADWQDSLDVYENMLHTRTLAYRSRLPVVEQSLSRADLESMVDSKLALDTRVERIAGERDTLALASEREFELWGEIASMENRAALNADIPEAREVRQKLGLLKGVLIWRLDKQYRERLYELRRKLRDTGEALVVAQRSRRQIDQSMRDEPQTFAAFGERIDGLAPRIASLAARVDKVRIRQQQYLQDIAIGEMQARKDRLDTYTVQARFALAAIYDRSSSAGGASP